MRIITRRSIGLSIILSIVTCGIYSLYWVIQVNDDMNEACGTRNDTSGIMVLLLSILTCNIYGVYWAYKMGCKMDEANRIPGSNSGIFMLIIEFFGLGIVNLCIMQDFLNKRAAL